MVENTAPKLFLLCLFGFALPFLYGCGNRVSLTATEQAKADKILAEHGKEVIPHYLFEVLAVGTDENLVLKHLEYFVSQGADVNARDTVHWSPLHWATLGGRVETIKFLVSKGADVNAKDKKDTTPLHNAAMIGHVEVVKFLVSQGADVNAQTDREETPLDLAKENPLNITTEEGISAVVEYLTGL